MSLPKPTWQDPGKTEFGDTPLLAWIVLGILVCVALFFFGYFTWVVFT